MDADSAVSQVQRRIELQSPEDLTYLITNVRNAAATRLNEAFPQVDGGGEDELRNQIEALVNEYIDKTFTLAAPNLTINGLPVASVDALRDSGSMALDEAYEPFDTRKRQRVADLITQEEKLLEDVASLKRAVPGKAAAEHAQMLREALRRDDEMVGAMAATHQESANETITLDGTARLDRQETVEGEFKDAVEALGRLKRDMSTVVAKMERARQAGEYVITQGR
ncbi:uncharacterized protein J7T54_001057 [Emericellopsis cladophorae]|uniref:Kinetochore protein mis14 n=1 Tax=Emericellopsis cladophorae TaxID=2686198 RepID=A0A9P9Y0K7_9HYPO|nr:uncharacterized protein J7T54_001057 [Emericellopsis cladophorae]KAI6780749.1 hypothetical protein J7T54_001057 [Emericellopsis cladophorae]